MSSSLTPPKCPSCKIIFLRPVYHVTSPVSPSKKAPTPVLFCPACEHKYSIRKGSILPAIVLNSSLFLHNEKTEKEQDMRHSPSAAGSIHVAGNHAPFNRLPVRNFPLRSRSFNSKKDSSLNSLNSGNREQALSLIARSRRFHQQRGRFIQHENAASSPSLLNNSPNLSANYSSNERIFQAQNAESHGTVSDKGTRIGGSFGKFRIQSSSSSSSSSSTAGAEKMSKSTDEINRQLPPLEGRSFVMYRRHSLTEKHISSHYGPEMEKYLSTIDSLENGYTYAKKSENYTHLRGMYCNTFSSWEQVIRTFKEDVEESTTTHKLAIRMDFVQRSYSILMEMPGTIQKAVMRSIINGVMKETRTSSYKQPEKKRDYIRAHLILMENPQFGRSSTYVVFAQLLRVFSQMSANAHKCIIQWVGLEYSPESVRKLLSKLQQFVSFMQFPPHKSDLPPIAKSGWINHALDFMSLMNEASQMKQPHMLSQSEFYNFTLDHINLKKHFHDWKENLKDYSARKFTYCNYPFVLSLSAKKTILQKDSEQQMLFSAKRSLEVAHNMHLTEDFWPSDHPHPKNVFLHLTVRRSHLIQDSMTELMKGRKNLKKKVRVTFANEPGVDMGGLTKEWFLLLVRSVLHPEYGLFTHQEYSGFCWFSLGLADDHRRSEYHLIGTLMGLALYNSTILDLNFPLCCFKKLLSPSGSSNHFKFTLADLAVVMPTIANSLKALQEHDWNSEDLCQMFEVSHQVFGATVTTELIPNGRSVPVTNQNKAEFVERYVDHLLNRSIEVQFTAFYHGFHTVCDSKAIDLLTAEELETLICGCAEFDMHALRSVAMYDGYEETDITIRHLWEVLEGLSGEEQQRFLLFVTGSPRMPVDGARSIEFKISRLSCSTSEGTTELLPMAHTCFNQLLLPPYKTKKTLQEKLVVAIDNSEGFGLV